MQEQRKEKEQKKVKRKDKPPENLSSGDRVNLFNNVQPRHPRGGTGTVIIVQSPTSLERVLNTFHFEEEGEGGWLENGGWGLDE